jgi:ribosomal protein L15
MAARFGQRHRRSVGRVGFIIEGTGNQARRRRLADTAHAGEHVGMGNTAGRKSIGQGAHHGVLADQVFKL